MELIERDEFLDSLQAKFEDVIDGEGHCILLSGEAGLGKTALIRAFCSEKKKDFKIYWGTCDALFTPRPLAPLYDIAWQMKSELWQHSGDVEDRVGLFSGFFNELYDQKDPTIIIFEDIHWADEATLDFIKFFARRITQVHCLFILTYRDDEIHSNHPLRSVLGQLPADSFTRMQLTPLSKESVQKMALEKGYSGEDVYTISGGNPFYINEILASYSPGVPDNIKDSILSVYHRQEEKTKNIWSILSVLPTGFEVKYLEMIEPLYADVIKSSLDVKILIIEDGYIFFKHELYRRTIEASLSPLVRLSINKSILDMFLETFEQNKEAERIIHHAKNANEYDLVAHYAPIAARQAASIGSHIEASKLYYSAIEYYQQNDQNKLIELYEAYAYECYLISRIKEAILYQTKSLIIRKEQNDKESLGNCIRFLSRLWWYDGNRKEAEIYANQAVEVLDDQPASVAKAMAYSNISQLKMLSDELAECLHWGEMAIDIAKQLGNEEILCHALNNIGTVQMENELTKEKGVSLLQQSLNIALKNSYHEHAARAYVNLAANAIKIKDYDLAKKTIDAGIQYSEKRDLDSWSSYLLAFKARMNLERGDWNEAYSIAETLMQNENQITIAKIVSLVVIATINMRKGESEDKILPLLLKAKEKAFETMELQRIFPVFSALLEYEWLTGNEYIEKASVDLVINMIGTMGHIYEINEFAFWLAKARKQPIPRREFHEKYKMNTHAAAQRAAHLWNQLGCPYMQALALFEGTITDKKRAITIIHLLGAHAVYEKLKLEMRTSGIKNIPRGKRKTTQANAAHLTQRELDVLQLLKEGLQNKEIAERLFISAKTVDHHISSILLKLNVSSRIKAVHEAIQLGI